MQPLSPREQEVFALVARGLQSKEIAHQLGISPRTVEAHRQRILRKYGAPNTIALVLRLTDGGGEHA
jgi:DNA-binding NarL/FixJ family response regulator